MRHTRTSLHTHTHTHTHSYLLNILPGPDVSAMNIPRRRGFANVAALVQVKHRNWASMKLRKQFRMRPFIFVLPNGIESNSAGIQSSRVRRVTCEVNKVAHFVIIDVRLHFLYFASAYGTMSGPLLMTLALFVFLPVPDFSKVAAYAFPVLVATVFIAPKSDRVTCDERTD